MVSELQRIGPTLRAFHFEAALGLGREGWGTRKADRRKVVQGGDSDYMRGGRFPSLNSGEKLEVSRKGRRRRIRGEVRSRKSDVIMGK